MDLARLRQRYDEYVATFRTPEGRLPPMMELKRVHTAGVVANARAIAEGERMDAETAAVCEAAALLHDTGRYEQLRRYNTFRDSDSVDHAVFSHDIVREKGWLDGCVHADAILKAVLYHNRRDLPDGLDTLTATAAHCTRDADKLDIFRVLEHQLATDDWRNGCTAFWGLPVRAKPTPEVLAAIREGRPVDYQHIKTLADFVLIQVGWMRAGLHFGTTRRLAAERGHLAFRRNFLAELLSDDPAVPGAKLAGTECKSGSGTVPQEVDALCSAVPLGEITFADVVAARRRGCRVLLLVRHAERPKIDGDDPTFGEALPLTDEGMRTSRRFGEQLRDVAEDVQFLSSPLLRTRLTAAGIAEGMGLTAPGRGGNQSSQRDFADMVPTDPLLGNSSFYFSDQHEVFELFRDGSFFEKIFAYMAAGHQRGFREIREASDAFEAWALERFTGALGIFATHDLYIGAFLHARGVKRDWTVANWVRFLDAAAILLEPDGTRRYALLRAGLSEGVMGVASP